MNILWDMETSDPDDVMTLCLLMCHPRVCLRSVTVTPGTDEQIGLVKSLLQTYGLDIPVGSTHPHYPKNCVSSFYRQWLGNFDSVAPDGLSADIINDQLRQYPDATILTGAPLKSFKSIASNLNAVRWVAQGGFAGDNIVPETDRLDKFKGKITCPTFNFNGDPSTALAMLANDAIQRKLLVAKNVCHGVVYDRHWHERLAAFRFKSFGLNMIYLGMSLYLDKNSLGKMFHDPLAACVAIDESVCQFKQVRPFRKQGEWGCELSDDSNTYISVSVDKERLWETFIQ